MRYIEAIRYKYTYMAVYISVMIPVEKTRKSYASEKRDMPEGTNKDISGANELPLGV